MNKLQIPFINTLKTSLPAYKTAEASGMDLRADLNPDYILGAGERALIPTGLFLAIPQGYEAQVRPRSGLAVEFGVTVLNSPGTVDADYRGEVKVLLINHGKIPFIIQHNDRIAQLVFAKVEEAVLVPVDALDETSRGSGGFNSTGIK